MIDKLLLWNGSNASERSGPTGSWVGNAEEGYPVFLLDLPCLFQKRDKDITNEFVLLIYVLLVLGYWFVDPSQVQEWIWDPSYIRHLSVCSVLVLDIGWRSWVVIIPWWRIYSISFPRMFSRPWEGCTWFLPLIEPVGRGDLDFGFISFGPTVHPFFRFSHCVKFPLYIGNTSSGFNFTYFFSND